MSANSVNAATAGSPAAPNRKMAVDSRALSRRMRLTRELVSRIARPIEDPGPLPGRAYATDADYEATSRALLAGRPPNGEVWIFAYGSLIWKPACTVVAQQVAVLRGWHRAFCLGWDRRYRGSNDRPRPILALHRGGTCQRVVPRPP